jgi:hypothetical protein
MSSIRQFDHYPGQNARGPAAQHKHPPRETQGLLDVVCRQERPRSAGIAKARSTPPARRDVIMLSRLASGSSSSSSDGSFTSTCQRHTLTMPPEKLMRPGIVEAVQPNLPQHIVDPLATHP